MSNVEGHVAFIVRDLPYFEHPTKVRVGRHTYPVKPEQIIVWISITEQGPKPFDPRTPRIPAILDTGCNHNLLINQQHLSVWAGLQPGFLKKLAGLRVSGERVTQLAANVWLHRNIPGRRDDLSDVSPWPLELLPGIAIFPATPGEPLYPRLPLLGLRAFQRGGLGIVIDCGNRRVRIRTRRRFWLW